MSTIGKYIRQLRQRTDSVLGEVTDFLDMDPSLLRKIERGQRNATKDQVIKLASYFGVDSKEMLTIYLSDRISQPHPTRDSSKRVRNISSELKQLHDRQIRTKIYKPSSPLNTYIEHVIYYCGNNKIHPYERVFPDGAVQLVIELGGKEKTLLPGNGIPSQHSLKKAWIQGVQKQPSTYQLEHKETTLSVRFTPGGFYALTDTPATETQNSFIDAELIFGPSILSLRKRLLSNTDLHTMFQTVEKYFSERVPSSGHKSSVVKYLISNINTAISELAQETAYTHKHIICLFKKHIGISPKYFQRIRRFNDALDDVLASQKIDWPDIVFNNGYYDQSHFIKEFNHFAGINPSDYIKTGSTCSKLLHLNEHR